MHVPQKSSDLRSGFLCMCKLVKVAALRQFSMVTAVSVGGKFANGQKDSK